MRIYRDRDYERDAPSWPIETRVDDPDDYEEDEDEEESEEDRDDEDVEDGDQPIEVPVDVYEVFCPGCHGVYFAGAALNAEHRDSQCPWRWDNDHWFQQRVSSSE